MTSTEYAPGEMIKQIFNKKPLYVSPRGLDMLLYVAYLLREAEGTVRATLGDLALGRMTDCDPEIPTTVYYVETFGHDTLLYVAKWGDKPWEITVCKDGEWQNTLETAYINERGGVHDLKVVYMEDHEY